MPISSTRYTGVRTEEPGWLVLWYFAGEQATAVSFRRRVGSPVGVWEDADAAGGVAVRCGGGWWYSPPIDLHERHSTQQQHEAVLGGRVAPPFEFGVWAGAAATELQPQGMFNPDMQAVLLPFPPRVRSAEWQSTPTGPNQACESRYVVARPPTAKPDRRSDETEEDVKWDRAVELQAAGQLEQAEQLYLEVAECSADLEQADLCLYSIGVLAERRKKDHKIPACGA